MVPSVVFAAIRGLGTARDIPLLDLGMLWDIPNGMAPYVVLIGHWRSGDGSGNIARVPGERMGNPIRGGAFGSVNLP